jgi:hypothetical protein
MGLRHADNHQPVFWRDLPCHAGFSALFRLPCHHYIDVETVLLLPNAVYPSLRLLKIRYIVIKRIKHECICRRKRDAKFGCCDLPDKDGYIRGVLEMRRLFGAVFGFAGHCQIRSIG